MAAKNKFDTTVIQEGWLAENDITQSYYLENKDRLHNSAQLVRDFDDQEFLKNGTLKQLQMDFFMRYKRGDIESADQYFKFLEDK